MPGLMTATRTILSAASPALFLASTATVKQFVHPSSYVNCSVGMAIWEIYAIYSFVSVFSAQTIANYKLQKKREREERHSQDEIDFSGCTCIQVKWFAYSMVLCKGANSALSIMDSLHNLTELATGGFQIALMLGVAIVSSAFGVAQSYGQLGSLLVYADEKDVDERITFETWHRRADKVSPAKPIIMGSGADAWFYNTTLFHAATELFDFMLAKEYCLQFFSFVSGDPNDASDNTIMMLGNALFLALGVVNAFTFIIVAQGWLEKFNDYLELDDVNRMHYFPEWFEKLVKKFAFKFNEEKKIYQEWQPLRNLVTHVKSLTGGVALAAIIIDFCDDHNVDANVNGVDVLRIIAPLIVLIGHAELARMHNLVNSSEGKISNLWNGYGIFNCARSICTKNPRQDNEGLLLEGGYIIDHQDFREFA